MRGMIKWRPFNSIITNEDIHKIENERQKISKPIIMEDRIIDINDKIINSYKNNLEIKIKYYNINHLCIIIGKIEKINEIEKYILVNRTRIYFKNIILINYL